MSVGEQVLHDSIGPEAPQRNSEADPGPTETTEVTWVPRGHSYVLFLFGSTVSSEISTAWGLTCSVELKY